MADSRTRPQIMLFIKKNMVRCQRAILSRVRAALTLGLGSSDINLILNIEVIEGGGGVKLRKIHLCSFGFTRLGSLVWVG